MNINDLTYILQNPTLVKKEHADGLEQLIREFPYFQPSRALLLKHYKDQESFKYNLALKTTAAYTTDRSILFDFITSLSATPVTIENTSKKDNLPSMPFDEAIKMKMEEAESVLSPSLFYVKEEEITEKPIEETPQEKLSSQDAILSVNTTPNSEETAIEKTSSEEDSLTTTTAIDTSIIDKGSSTTVDSSELKEENTIAEEKSVKPTTTFKHSTIHDVLADKEKEVKRLEEKLEIHKPLSFNKSEVHSFKEWLRLTTLKPIEREDEEINTVTTVSKVDEPTVQNTTSTPEASTEEVSETKPTKEISDKNTTEKKSKFDIIDQFIASNPKIPPVAKRSGPTKNLASEHIIPTDSLMTETLAKVYLAQNNYKKAIQAYKILILKNPEKSGFFADQIRAINKLQENK
ncbi:hypothetical protein [Aquimarina rhabdastrellae]